MVWRNSLTNEREMPYQNALLFDDALKNFKLRKNIYLDRNMRKKNLNKCSPVGEFHF